MAQKTLTAFSADTETPRQGLTYEDITTPDELIEWSRQYAQEAVEEYEVNVDLGLVHWGVTTNTKRLAAGTETYTPNGASPGIPIDWEKTRERLDSDLTEDDEHIEDVRECFLRLSWTAFEAFDRERWMGVIRHELVHIEQHQRFGACDHGRTFKIRAREMDAPVDCPEFVEAKYHLHCTDCGELDCKRHRKSKVVKQPADYLSGCCEAPLEVRPGPAHE